LNRNIILSSKLEKKLKEVKLMAKKKPAKKVRCLAKTKDGKRCKRLVTGKGKYCVVHKKR
jgi:hypothetical protein